MRLFLLFILVLTVNLGRAQINPSQINFGQIMFELKNEPITQQDLETILNTFSAFGDKEIIFQEVLKSFLIKPNTEFADSLIDFWISDFSKEDSLRLTNVLNSQFDFRERVLNNVFYTYLAKSYSENISLIEAMIKTMQEKPQNFPHIPDQGSYTGLTSAINSYYMFSKWYLQYPEEFTYFENKMKEYTIAKMGSFSEKKLKEFVDLIVKDVKDRRLIYELYLPQVIIPEIIRLRAYQANNTANSDVNTLSEAEIAPFLKDKYFEIFEENLSEKDLLDLKEYVITNNLNDPKIIYLALIFSKYE